MVAVKVQHPRVKPHSLVDMASMEVQFFDRPLSATSYSGTSHVAIKTPSIQLLLAGGAAEGSWKVSSVLAELAHETGILFYVGGILLHFLRLVRPDRRRDLIVKWCEI
uniref:Uncharacterized protein n=1 Tax=Parascaris equorum TaxID=6256 RepID=A0A914R6G8_PAREQ